MKRPPLRYPKWVWIYLLILLVFTWIPYITWFSYLGLALIAISAPKFRDAFLNPMPGSTGSYFNWLKTVPYKASKPLPNGSVFLNWQDLLFLSMLAAAGIPATQQALVWKIFIVTALPYLAVLSFSGITARQLLNLGPRWIAYAIAGTVLLSLRTIITSFQHPAYAWLPIASILLPFGLALFGLQSMMKAYPWSDQNPNVSGTIQNRSLPNLFYGYTDVTATGEPFTTLRPNGRWPRVPWSDCIYASLLAGLLMAWFDFGRTYEWIFVAIAGVPLYFRVYIYYSNKTGISRSLFKGSIGHAGNGPRITNAFFAVLILIFLVAGGLTVIHYTPHSFSRIFAPVYMVIIYIAAIKLPPSRSVWETMGKWQIKNQPVDFYLRKTQLVNLDAKSKIKLINKLPNI